ncbi:winged helix-turn-helix domain-containing protein [Botrimarina sp.]|uniref:winged helix-turn-helix domain-containing protein n=1 Tax=Botrimarina sp. TaxID=2795802 RepID=UPI0032EC980D
MNGPTNGPPPGCGVLPPMTPPTPRPDADRAEPKPDATAKRRAAGRFGVLNRFADNGARLVDTTAQACWWILYRETKPDGLATVSHQRVADCVGVDRKTVTRALARLERARLLTVVRHGGWRRGPSTYRVHPTPKRPPPTPTKTDAKKGKAASAPSTTSEP